MSNNNTEFFKHPIARSELSIALEYIGEHFKNIDYVIFFGTLLGITRDGDVINGDDDIDLVISLTLKEAVLEIFKKSDIKLDLQKKG